MTKAAFLQEYESAVVSGYPWAKDAAKLKTFMIKVKETLAGPCAPWDFHGPSTVTAWRAIGGKGQPTLKALRALA